MVGKEEPLPSLGLKSARIAIPRSDRKYIGFTVSPSFLYTFFKKKKGNGERR